MGEEGTAYVVEALAFNPGCTAVDLSKNGIASVGKGGGQGGGRRGREGTGVRRALDLSTLSFQPCGCTAVDVRVNTSGIASEGRG